MNMKVSNQNSSKGLLVLIEMVGEHYWSVLLAGLVIFSGSATYGYFFEQNTFLMLGIYGAITFVFAPPAILMSSFLLSKLFDLIRNR